MIYNMRMSSKSEGRTIVVGDIHGCYDELMELLDKVGFAKKDRLVSVGDLIAKGPKSREVLELFMSDERLSTVIGNHDLILRRRWNGEDIELKAAQKQTHKRLKSEKDRYCLFLIALPFVTALRTHRVVHADFPPPVTLHPPPPPPLPPLTPSPP